MSDQFVLHGVARSGPTYKVGLMLALCDQKYAYRHVDMMQGQHKSPDFLKLNRYGQVPVLTHGAVSLCQSGAILEYLAETLGKLRGKDTATRARAREWLYWDADRLSPGVYRTRAILRGFQKAEPVVADYFRQAGEAGLEVLNDTLGKSTFLTGSEATIADIACYGVCVWAPDGKFDLKRWPNVGAWMKRIEAMPGYKAPLDLLPMHDAA